MALDRFQGDPRLIMHNSGVTLDFLGGQPDMDQGFENQAQIALFTSPGWWGNLLTDNPDEKIGSNFEEQARGAITLSKLNDIKQSGESALASPAFGNVEMTVTNPEHWRIDATTLIQPPGQDVQELLISRNGQNWINQKAQGETT